MDIAFRCEPGFSLVGKTVYFCAGAKNKNGGQLGGARRDTNETLFGLFGRHKGNCDLALASGGMFRAGAQHDTGGGKKARRYEDGHPFGFAQGRRVSRVPTTLRAGELAATKTGTGVPCPYRKFEKTGTRSALLRAGGCPVPLQTGTVRLTGGLTKSIREYPGLERRSFLQGLKPCDLAAVTSGLKAPTS